MDFSWMRPFIIKTRRYIIKNAPHILMGMGTAGSVSSFIMAVRATPMAMQAKKDAEWIKSNGGEDADEDTMRAIPQSSMEKLTMKETIKACGKFYIAPVGLELASLACFWGAHGIDIRRQAILAGLYSTAEATLQEYQKKVVQLIGEKNEREIEKGVHQDFVDRNPPPVMNIFGDSSQEMWCVYDKQYFRSSWVKIKDTQNDANYEMIQNQYLSKAEFMWLLDPDRKYLKPAPDDFHIGWTLDRMMEIDIDPGVDENHCPVLYLEIKDKNGNRYNPFPNFSTLH